MAGAFGKIFGKIFGNKADKDFKELSPFTGKVNEEYITLQVLSNDELRGKTETFREQIRESLSEITGRIDELKANADAPDIDVNALNAAKNCCKKLLSISLLFTIINSTRLQVETYINSLRAQLFFRCCKRSLNTSSFK